MDNRALLLDCALGLFAGRGYEAVGIQEICAATRLTKPTLYYYFTSKGGLLAAILEENYPALLEAARQAAVYQASLGDSLEQVGRAGLSFARERPVFYRLHLALQAAPPESEPARAAAPYCQARREILETLFIQAVRQHSGLRGRQGLLAATFCALLDAYAALYLDGAVPLSELLLRQLSQQFLHGVL